MTHIDTKNAHSSEGFHESSCGTVINYGRHIKLHNCCITNVVNVFRQYLQPYIRHYGLGAPSISWAWGILVTFRLVYELSALLPSSPTSARQQHPWLSLLWSIDDVRHARRCDSEQAIATCCESEETGWRNRHGVFHAMYWILVEILVCQGEEARSTSATSWNSSNVTLCMSSEINEIRYRIDCLASKS